MNIVVKEELKAYIDPLTAEEHDALERSILAEGCRDALVLWGDILIDGHNRYGICIKHGLPFNTVQNTRFQSMEDVHLWMIEQHLGRRSVSDFQRGVLALRKRDILAQRHALEQEKLRREADGELPAAEDSDADSPPWEPAPKVSKADMAREARLSAAQVTMIEKIHTQATPEVVQALKSGDISISAAAVVASLPEEEQRAAARAGKEELKQAAKRAREAKRKPRADKPAATVDSDGQMAEPYTAPQVDLDAMQALRQRVALLEAENAQLRRELAQLREHTGAQHDA